MEAPIMKEKLSYLTTVFLEKNKDINLSALRTFDACYTGNILDSIAAYDFLTENTKPNNTIIDIGTGGGFPLLPLALYLPDRRFTGVDAIAKKIKAIEEIATTCGIENTSFVTDRCEVIGQLKKYRETFNICTSRAVASLAVLLEYMAPFVRPDGFLLCYKSMQIEEELEASLHAQKVLHCPLIQQISYTLPGDFGTRQLLVFQKKDTLSKEYPRAVGIPKKTPL